MYPLITWSSDFNFSDKTRRVITETPKFSLTSYLTLNGRIIHKSVSNT